MIYILCIDLCFNKFISLVNLPANQDSEVAFMKMI